MASRMLARAQAGGTVSLWGSCKIPVWIWRASRMLARAQEEDTVFLSGSCMDLKGTKSGKQNDRQERSVSHSGSCMDFEDMNGQQDASQPRQVVLCYS